MLLAPSPGIAESPARRGGKDALRFVEDGPMPGGRTTLYAEPLDGMYYSLGLDFALGIPGKNLDAGVLLDTNREQAATLHGHWGEKFIDVIVPLVDYFGKERVFIVGENTAHGIPWLRWLYDHGYWLYFERDAKTRGNVQRDLLGHTPKQWDPTIKLVRAKLNDPDAIRVRDPELHSQLCKFGFLTRSQSKDPDAAMDSDLTWGAPRNENDDLVRALCYGSAGVDWLPQFDPPKPKLKPGTIGAMLRMDEDPDFTGTRVLGRKPSIWSE